MSASNPQIFQCKLETAFTVASKLGYIDIDISLEHSFILLFDLSGTEYSQLQ